MIDYFSAFICCVDCDIPVFKKTKRGAVHLRDYSFVRVSDDHSKVVCNSCVSNYPESQREGQAR